MLLLRKLLREGGEGRRVRVQAVHVPCSLALGLHVLHVSSFKHRRGSLWLPWVPCVPGCRAGSTRDQADPVLALPLPCLAEGHAPQHLLSRETEMDPWDDEFPSFH